MPGSSGVYHNGTSFSCGIGLSSNYSLRFYRNENFAAGLYSFLIGGDDGVRLSTDGGVTWLLDAFKEQPFTTITTNTNYPTGTTGNW